MKIAATCSNQLLFFAPRGLFGDNLDVTSADTGRY